MTRLREDWKGPEDGRIHQHLTLGLLTLHWTVLRLVSPLLINLSTKSGGSYQFLYCSHLKGLAWTSLEGRLGKNCAFWYLKPARYIIRIVISMKKWRLKISLTLKLVNIRKIEVKRVLFTFTRISVFWDLSLVTIQSRRIQCLLGQEIPNWMNVYQKIRTMTGV